MKLFVRSEAGQGYRSHLILLTEYDLRIEIARHNILHRREVAADKIIHDIVLLERRTVGDDQIMCISDTYEGKRYEYHDNLTSQVIDRILLAGDFTHAD
jgi:hypothetical protein